MRKNFTLTAKMQCCLMAVLMLASSLVATAQSSTGKPFGFATCTSRTATGYNLTGGGAITYEEAMALPESKRVVLTSTGSDMKGTIESYCYNQNISVIILDGSNGPFILKHYAELKSISNKTIIGINNAIMETQWYATDDDIAALKAARVDTMSTSKYGGTLTNGQSVTEHAEYATRQIMIDRYAPTAKTTTDEWWRNSGIFYIHYCQNIIIRNITFKGPGSMDLGGTDIISFKDNNKNIWIDHCVFSDGQDGNMDITNGSDLFTVSWCKFYYTSRSYMHQNTNLCGGSDKTTTDDDKLSITWAYNWWAEGCKERMPMARFGRFHILNNYYTPTGCNVCVNPRINSEVLVEGNYFDKSLSSIYSEKNPTQVIWRSNNSVNNASATHPTADDKTTTWTSGGTSLFPYTYTLIDTDKVPTEISENAGATFDSSNACQLTGIQFSNTAYGSINEPADGNNGTIVVPYMKGENEPSIVESSIVKSAKSTYNVTGNTLVVTAQDGTTKETYDITKKEMNPLDASKDIATTAFTETPSWIYSPYAYDATKGVRFAKAVDDATNMRIAKGWTRQYYFLTAGKTLTLTSATSSRAINVYVNGTKLDAPTATGASGSTIDIALDQTKNNMVCIESNQNGGDGGFSSYSVTATGSTGINTTNASYDSAQSGKYIQNNQIIIVKNGKKYTLAGVELK